MLLPGGVWSPHFVFGFSFLPLVWRAETSGGSIVLTSAHCRLCFLAITQFPLLFAELPWALRGGVFWQQQIQCPIPQYYPQ